ncbi:MAG: hypothetical protein RIG62_05470 [Cyclobacteriaceae bacterium]
MMTVYHVHLNLFHQGELISGVDLEKINYTPVALVMTDHMGTAYGLTQHPKPRPIDTISKLKP